MAGETLMRVGPCTFGEGRMRIAQRVAAAVGRRKRSEQMVPTPTRMDESGARAIEGGASRGLAAPRDLVGVHAREARRQALCHRELSATARLASSSPDAATPRDDPAPRYARSQCSRTASHVQRQPDGAEAERAGIGLLVSSLRT